MNFGKKDDPNYNQYFLDNSAIRSKFMNLTELAGMLKRFENEIESPTLTHERLIELFCCQIIPFLRKHPAIELLKIDWYRKYQKLNGQIRDSRKSIFRRSDISI